MGERRDPRSWLELTPRPRAPSGLRSWLLLGLFGVAAIAIWLLTLSASIVIPLILAVILGVVFAPLVDIMQRYKVPRALGATITMLLVLAIAGGTIWIVVDSVLGQWATIGKQMTSAYNSLAAWFAGLSIPASATQTVQSAAKDIVPKVSTWFANLFFSGLSSAAAFAFGTFLAFYMLFFTLKDSELIARTVGKSMGLPSALGETIVRDSFTAVRQYFQGTTMLAIITTAATGIGLWFLHVPLIGPICVVTFILSYIPFFGAIISTVFAVLIALGAGGPEMAISTLVLVLFTQNILQSAVQGWAIGGALDLHPIIVLVATTLGGIFGGLLGGMLGAPIAAIVVRVAKRLREAWAAEKEPDAAGTPADVAPEAVG